jgi:proteasome lid subunit RPN8/RPN11
MPPSYFDNRITTDSLNQKKSDREVILKKDVRDGILSFCKIKHPNEGILILRGKNRKGTITIDGLIIPPFAYGGSTYSGFPHYRLPADTSYVGIIHSHPSGSAQQSITDQNNFWGLISLIVKYPYDDDDIFAWDSKGNSVKMTVI